MVLIVLIAKNGMIYVAKEVACTEFPFLCFRFADRSAFTFFWLSVETCHTRTITGTAADFVVNLSFLCRFKFQKMHQ